MAVIKDYIQAELLKMIEEEKSSIYSRRVISDTHEEIYQINAEENFIKRLERFVKSI